MSDETRENPETLADAVARYMSSLSDQEQEARLIDRLLLCQPTAACTNALERARLALETLERPPAASEARLADARAATARWEARQADCIERDRRTAERRTLGAAYAECFCLGEGGAGELVGIAVPVPDGIAVARVNDEIQYTRERVCTCPDGQAFREEVEEWRAQAVAQYRAARVARIAGAAGIPSRYRGLTLDTWAGLAEARGGSGAHIRTVLDGIDAWQTDTPRLLLLAGNQGVGKSGLAAVLAQEWVDQEKGVLYRSVENLAAQLRAAPWRAIKEPDALPTELALLDALADVDLLVLDDLGVEAMTAGSSEILCALLTGILGRRMDACRWTIVTANLTPDEVLERYGARIYDRLYADEVALTVEVAVPNLRWRPKS